jgi:hypothetical protein
MFALDELQHYPVDWKDGMRVSAKDFAATDRAWTDALRDVRSSLFQGLQFGLLPALRDSSDTSPYPKLAFEASRSLLILQECRAITEGGYRVEITEDLQRQMQMPRQFPQVRVNSQEDFDVYISVDLFKPEGAGKLLPDAPPRHQYVSPTYELSVLPKSEGVGLSGLNHLKIAEYKWSKSGFKRNDDFIPACMVVAAHPLLSERFSRAGGILKTIHDNSILLVRTYRADSRPDVKDAAMWVDKLATFIAQALWTYNDLLANQSPLQTVTYFKNLAQFVLSTTNLQDANPYIKEGIRSQHSMFKDLADPNFDGEDLRTTFNRIDTALRSLHLWLKALSESFKQGRVIKVEEIRNP